MSYYEIKPETLRSNLEFIRQEIGRFQQAHDELNNKPDKSRSDDADTLLRGYSRVLNELKALIRHDYDVENNKVKQYEQESFQRS